MSNPRISPGTPVVIVDADGGEHETTASTAVEVEGHAFPIVWVERRHRDGAIVRVPWPLDAVRPLGQ